MLKNCCNIKLIIPKILILTITNNKCEEINLLNFDFSLLLEYHKFFNSFKSDLVSVNLKYSNK